MAWWFLWLVACDDGVKTARITFVNTSEGEVHLFVDGDVEEPANRLDPDASWIDTVELDPTATTLDVVASRDDRVFAEATCTLPSLLCPQDTSYRLEATFDGGLRCVDDGSDCTVRGL